MIRIALYDDWFVSIEKSSSIIPLLAIAITNLVLIVGALFLATIGKTYTSINLVCDEDVRNFELDQLEGAVGSTCGYYLYIVRLYFIDLFHLEKNADAMLDDTSIDEDEDSSNDEGNIVDKLIKIQKRKRDRDRARILVIELVNLHRRHLTKLELNLLFLRKCYIRKMPYATALPANLNQADTRPEKQKGSLYLVKFLFERNRPLTNVAFMRIRQLSSNFSLFLYRVEIQDTAAENHGIACHVNSLIEPSVKCFPTLTSDRYTPRPLDRAFNSTKLIWTEMTLFLLLGLNLVTLISLNLLDFTSVYEHKSHHSADRLYWTQAFFGSGLAAVVAAFLSLSYRLFTSYRPQYRKKTQKVVTVLLSLVVIALSVTCTILAFKHSSIYEYTLLKKWVEAYFLSVLIFILFSLVIVAGDVCIFLFC